MFKDYEKLPGSVTATGSRDEDIEAVLAEIKRGIGGLPSPEIVLEADPVDGEVYRPLNFGGKNSSTINNSAPPYTEHEIDALSGSALSVVSVRVQSLEIRRQTTVAEGLDETEWLEEFKNKKAA